MIYDFIEIGTSCFDVMGFYANDEDIGLSIEPLRHYLEGVPVKKNVTKVYAAISDKDGEMDLYYIPHTEIYKNKLPNWLLGCNKIGKPHPSCINILKNENLSLELIKKMIVPVISFETLVKKYNIKGIKN